MGAAASLSALHRLRKLLLIRAYNTNPNQSVTLASHFLPHAIPSATNPDKMVMTPDGIRAAVNLVEIPLLDDLMEMCGGTIPRPTNGEGLGNKKGEIEFEAFVSFLEKGVVPERRRKSKVKQRLHQSLSAPNITLSSSSTPNSPNTTPERNKLPNSRPSSSHTNLPPSHPPPQIVSPPASPTEENPSTASVPQTETFAEPPNPSSLPPKPKPRILAFPTESLYPSVLQFLGFRPPVHCRELNVNVNKNFGLKRFPATGRPLWKKQETVIQERIVKYVTVEPDGSYQELVETEKNQTEVTHMECKDTGEFAHKETTEYEMMETFNEEIVMAERGTEQYVHLKSLEDEYENLESHMPRKEREREAAVREQEEHEAMLRQMEEERELRMKMEAEMEAERIKMGGDPNEPLPPDYAPPDATPMGFRLGDPMPPGLTEEEQVYWHSHQRALLEEQYMKQMINDNISLSGEEGGGPMFYENGIGSPDPQTHSTLPPHNPIPPPTEDELLMGEEEEMPGREEMMKTQNIVLEPPVVLEPAVVLEPPQEQAAPSPFNAIPAPGPTVTPTKEGIFTEQDEENQHPNDARNVAAAPTLLSSKSPGKSPGLKNAEAVFASPTPSDKAAGLD